MKIRSIETLHCDSGWRNYHFVKLTTEDGVVGYSEYDEHQGAIGVTAVVEKLAPMLLGERVHDIERVYARLHARRPPVHDRRDGHGHRAIENALLDAKAKRRSACPATICSAAKCATRCACTGRTAELGGSPAATSIRPPSPISAACERSAKKCANAASPASKTNVFDFSAVASGGRVRGWAPGFGSPYAPDRNVERHVFRELRRHLEAFREGAGEDMDILLDLNYNAAPEGYRRILRALEDFDFFWVEIDTEHPEALADVRAVSPHAIASCESLLTLPAFLPTSGCAPWTWRSST